MKKHDPAETIPQTMPEDVERTQANVLQSIHIAQRCCCLSGALGEMGLAGEQAPIKDIAALTERTPLVTAALIIMTNLRGSSGNNDCGLITIGPLIPNDWMLRLATRFGRPDTTETPHDLYTQEEVTRWMTRTPVPVSQYASMYVHNISRQIAGTLRGKVRESIVHTFLTPLYFVCHHNGWETGLEYIDALWSAGWFLDLAAISRLRTDVWQCSLEGNDSCKTLSYREFCEALDKVTMKSDGRMSELVVPEEVEKIVLRIQSTIKRARIESHDLESWLLELHNISPLVNGVFSMLMAQRRLKAMSSSQQERLLRITAEIDCDIREVMRDPFYLLPTILVHTVTSQPKKIQAVRALRYFVHGRVSVPEAIASKLSRTLDALVDWPPSSKGDISDEVRNLMKQSVCQATRIAYGLFHGEQREQQIDKALSRQYELAASVPFLALSEPARAIASFLGMCVVHRLVNSRTLSISYNLGLSERQDVEVIAGTDEKGRCCAIRLAYKQDIYATDQHPTILADVRSLIAAIDLASPYSLDPDALKLLAIHSSARNSMLWIGLDRTCVTSVFVLPVKNDSEKINCVVELGQFLQANLGGVFYVANADDEIHSPSDQ